MPGDFARSVQILVSLSGNIENQLNNINAQLDKLAGRKIFLNTEGISQLTNSANTAAGSINKISDTTKSTEKNMVSSFGSIKNSIEEVNAGVGNLISSLAGIAVGGSISGLAWLQSAEAVLYNEQIEEAISNNKKLGFTYDDLKKKVEEQVKGKEGTRQDTEKEFYSTIMAAQKYIAKGPKALDAADAIGDFYFAHQELMAGQGINSPEEMIQRAVRSEGEMGALFGKKFATAMGIAYEDKAMKSAKARVKFFVEKGSQVNMTEELAKRPWEEAVVALARLKMDIGDSLAIPLSKITTMFATLVDIIRQIPGGAHLIGWSAMLLTAVSIMGLLNSVLTPGIALLRQMILLTNLDTIAKAKNLLVSKALIVTDWLGVTSKAASATATATTAASTAAFTGAIGMEIVALEADAVATMGAAGATTTLAAAEWAALSPLLLIAIPLIAVAGLLYLVEKRTHVFSDALKQLSETEMSQDIIKWFQDVGYWIGFAVDKFGGAIGNNLTNNINAMNSLYKMLKSGAGGIGQLFNMGSGTTESGNVLLLTQKLFNPIFLMTTHLETLVSLIFWIKNFFEKTGSSISGIYNGIMKLPENFGKWILSLFETVINKLTSYFTEAINTLKGMLPSLPSWLGGNGSKSEEGFIDFIRNTKKGDANYDKYAQLSDDTLRAAYREAQTGTSQAHANLTDTYGYDNIVKNGYSEYMNSNGSGSNSVGNLLDQGKTFVQEKIIKPIDENLIKPVYGYLQSGYNYLDGLSGGRISGFKNSLGFANGGYVKKSGYALVHSGEPIIPADVANSSRLQGILENIAYGGATTTNQGDINVNINYTAPTGSSSNMIVMDKLSFERMVSDIIAKKLRQLNGY